MRSALLWTSLLCGGLLAQDRRVVENEFVRVVSVTSPPGAQSRMHEHLVNRVMVYLDEGEQILRYEDGRERHPRWKAGDAHWDPAGGRHTSHNTYSKPYRIAEIELKRRGPGGALERAAGPVLLENEFVRVTKVERIVPRRKGPAVSVTPDGTVTLLAGSQEPAIGSTVVELK